LFRKGGGQQNCILACVPKVVYNSSMEQKVGLFIRENDLISPDRAVGVGASGGIDSMALLFLLKRMGFLVCALHFEHGIRGEESRADADFVRRYCQENNIPFVMESGDAPEYAKQHKLSLESAARELRYAFFERSGLEAVATAHHMDDNAESILMHIARGCGIDGLAGIHMRQDRIVRPFLCVTRQEIEAYAQENRISYVTDKTNADVRYTRNRVRHLVMEELKKINPDIAGAFGRLSQNAQETMRMIGAQADRVSVAYDEFGGSVDAAVLHSLDEPVAREVLLRMCAHAGYRTDIELVHIKSVLELCRTGAFMQIKKGIFAKYLYGRLIIYKKSDRINDVSFCVPLADETHIPGGVIRKTAECLNKRNEDRFCETFGHLPDDAVVRSRKAGDVFAPFGSGEKKLKDYMIDQKIPREMRDSVPLVATGNRIIWVVGYAISRDFAVRIEDETTRLTYSKG
jgi:tRNA(Ile)-lysidine synthase